MAGSDNIVIAILAIAAVTLLFGVASTAGIGPTGFVTFQTSDTGDANVSVIARTSVTVTTPDVNIGTLDPGDTNDSTGTSGIILENSGSVDINLTVNGTTPFTSSVAGDDFAAGVRCKVRSCEGAPTHCLDDVYYECDTNTVSIVGTLEFEDSKDELIMDANMTVPVDEPAGDKGSTFVFTATAS